MCTVNFFHACFFLHQPHSVFCAFFFFFFFLNQLWHCWQHQRDWRPGEEAGHPVQRPDHQHAHVVFHLLRAGVRGERQGHYCGARDEGKCVSVTSEGKSIDFDLHVEKESREPDELRKPAFIYSGSRFWNDPTLKLDSPHFSRRIYTIILQMRGPPQDQAQLAKGASGLNLVRHDL